MDAQPKKIKISFGMKPQSMPNPADDMGQETGGKDYQGELMQIKEALMSGDHKQAMQLIDQCLGQENQEEGQEPQMEEGMPQTSMNKIAIKIPK